MPLSDTIPRRAKGAPWQISASHAGQTLTHPIGLEAFEDALSVWIDVWGVDVGAWGLDEVEVVGTRNDETRTVRFGIARRTAPPHFSPRGDERSRRLPPLSGPTTLHVLDAESRTLEVLEVPDDVDPEHVAQAWLDRQCRAGTLPPNSAEGTPCEVVARRGGEEVWRVVVECPVAYVFRARDARAGMKEEAHGF